MMMMKMSSSRDESIDLVMIPFEVDCDLVRRDSNFLTDQGLEGLKCCGSGNHDGSDLGLSLAVEEQHRKDSGHSFAGAGE